MPIRMKFSPVDGFAIYTVPTPDSTDDTPLTDPFADLSRVIVHPALRYPGVVATLTGTLTIPAPSSPGVNMRRVHALGAHGQPGRPMIVGRILGAGVGGVDIPWRGSYGIAPEFSTPEGMRRTLNFSCWLTLGVQGADIVAYENSSGSFTGTEIDYEILIFNRDLTSALPNSGPARARISGNAFLFETPKGTISSEHRYLKLASGGGSWAISGGRTTTINGNETVGSSIVKETTFKHSYGSGVYEVAADYVIRSTPDQYLPAPAVNPRTETVTA